MPPPPPMKPRIPWSTYTVTFETCPQSVLCVCVHSPSPTSSQLPFDRVYLNTPSHSRMHSSGEILTNKLLFVIAGSLSNQCGIVCTAAPTAVFLEPHGVCVQLPPLQCFSSLMECVYSCPHCSVSRASWSVCTAAPTAVFLEPHGVCVQLPPLQCFSSLMECVYSCPHCSVSRASWSVCTAAPHCSVCRASWSVLCVHHCCSIS